MKWHRLRCRRLARRFLSASSTRAALGHNSASEAPVARLRHLRSAYAGAIGASLLLACLANGQDRATWQPDRSEAIAQARKLGKLLLVVQFSGDFAKNA